VCSVDPGAREIVEQREHHEVEHDGDDHLVRTELRLEHAGHRAHHAAAQPGREDVDRQAEQRGDAGRQQQPHQRRREPAHRELALGADVEQAGPQTDTHCKASECQGRGLVQHLPEPVGISPRALEQERVHRAGRLTERQDQHVADDRRDQQRHERRKDRLLERHAMTCVHAARSAPVM
jgi:hypothetical protein